MCGVHTSLQHHTVAMESSRARATDDGDSGRPRVRAVKSPLSTSRLEHVVGKKRSKGPWFETVTKKEQKKKTVTERLCCYPRFAGIRQARSCLQRLEVCHGRRRPKEERGRPCGRRALGWWWRRGRIGLGLCPPGQL